MMDFTIDDLNKEYAAGRRDGEKDKMQEILSLCQSRICLDKKEDGFCSHSSCDAFMSIISILSSQIQALLNQPKF